MNFPFAYLINYTKFQRLSLSYFGFGGRTRRRGGVAGPVLTGDPQSPDLLGGGRPVGSLGHTGRPGVQHRRCQTGSHVLGSETSSKGRPAALRTPLRPMNAPAPSPWPWPFQCICGAVQSPSRCSTAPSACRRSQRIEKHWPPVAQSFRLPQALSWACPFFLTRPKADFQLPPQS